MHYNYIWLRGICYIMYFMLKIQQRQNNSSLAKMHLTDDTRANFYQR